MASIAYIYTTTLHKNVPRHKSIQGLTYAISDESKMLASGVVPLGSPKSGTNEPWSIIVSRVLDLVRSGELSPDIDILLGGGGWTLLRGYELERQGIAFRDHTMKPPPELTDDLMEQLSRDFISTMESNRLIYHVGTDASLGNSPKSDGSVSAAIIVGPVGVPQSERSVKAIMSRVSSDGGDVSLVEMKAIYLAIKNAPPNAKLYIRSDSAVCVASIAGKTTPRKHVMQSYCQHIQEYLKETGSEVRWVEGHRSDPLNIAADRHALNYRRSLSLPSDMGDAYADSISEWIIQDTHLEQIELPDKPVGIIPELGTKYKQDPLLPAPISESNGAITCEVA